MAQRRVPLFDTTEDQTLRIQKELAVKIGFNEAVILMQLEYLISISNKEIDGNLWTYQTLEELRENSFPWWSISTISRALTSLKDQDIIFIGNFNKHPRDRTQWFSLDFGKIKELGVRLNDKNPILQNEKWEQADIIMKDEAVPEEQIEPEKTPEPVLESPPILQDEKSILQIAKTILQNETTLPKTPTKIKEISPNGDSGQKPPPTKNKDSPPISVLAYRSVANRFPDKATWPAIAEAVGDSEADLQFWKEVVIAWIAKGYKKVNVDGMLDWFKKREIPRGIYKNGHKATQPNNRTGPTHPPVSATGLGEWTEDEKRRYGFT